MLSTFQAENTYYLLILKRDHVKEGPTAILRLINITPLPILTSVLPRLKMWDSEEASRMRSSLNEIFSSSSLYFLNCFILYILMCWRKPALFELLVTRMHW